MKKSFAPAHTEKSAFGSAAPPWVPRYSVICVLTGRSAWPVGVIPGVRATRAPPWA